VGSSRENQAEIRHSIAESHPCFTRCDRHTR
jgi:hypothetical protein